MTSGDDVLGASDARHLIKGRISVGAPVSFEPDTITDRDRVALRRPLAGSLGVVIGVVEISLSCSAQEKDFTGPAATLFLGVKRSESTLMQAFLPWIGGVAAVLTSLSYIPQVQKAWQRGSPKDISVKMLAVLTAGLVLWIAYGLLREDWVIILANGVGAAPSGTVLYCKLRDINH